MKSGPDIDYANLQVKAAEERAEEAWTLTKSYQESNDKVWSELLRCFDRRSLTSFTGDESAEGDQHWVCDGA